MEKIAALFLVPVFGSLASPAVKSSFTPSFKAWVPGVLYPIDNLALNELPPQLLASFAAHNHIEPRRQEQSDNDDYMELDLMDVEDDDALVMDSSKVFPEEQRDTPELRDNSPESRNETFRSNPSDCGTSNFVDRIVGGEESNPAEYPWNVALHLQWGIQFCGGSLISEKYVLTAAHCVAWGKGALKINVNIGDHHLLKINEAKNVRRKVKKLKIHRRYSAHRTNNDIALIELDEPVEFTENIRPICLPDPSLSYVGTTATVTGWGHQREGGQSSVVLREVEVDVISNGECKTKYRPSEITDVMMCAGKKQGGKDACQGDSGGPLVAKSRNDRWSIIGIVSWGKGCAQKEYPGVYTRVTEFISWINRHAR